MCIQQAKNTENVRVKISSKYVIAILLLSSNIVIFSTTIIFTESDTLSDAHILFVIRYKLTFQSSYLKPLCKVKQTL